MHFHAVALLQHFRVDTSLRICFSVVMIQSSQPHLSDICTVHSGFTTRRGLEPATDGGVLALQLRDVTVNGSVEIDTLQRVALDDIAARYLIQSGDVVFRSRGERTVASVVRDIRDERVVAILPLIIIRVNHEIADPNFIAWSINLPSSQRYLDAASQGGSVRMIPKSALDTLPLDIPNLETQRQIAAIAAMTQREAELSAELAEKKLTLNTLLLAEAAKHGTAKRYSNRSKP